MAYEMNEMSGSLFKNDKGDNPKRPDYTGKCLVNGKELRMSAWVEKSKGRTPYMSLKFSEPQGGGAPQRDSRQPAAAGAGAGYTDPRSVPPDDLPF